MIMSDKENTMNISVFGLGKVGITLAACLSAAGNKVIGVDVNPQLAEALNSGTFSTAEAGVMERLSQAGSRFTATTDPAQAVRESDLTFIIVPTPSNVLGGFSLRFVLPACEQIGQGLRSKTSEHTVAIVSTILPGSSDCRVMTQLQEASGRKVGDGLGYAYNPSFIALGEVIKGIETPDYVLIGESDRRAGDLVLAAHQTMTRNKAPIARVTPIEAEITKIASNTHETLRVSFANMLFSVCSEVPGANVDRITEALAHRMGRRFFKGAVPYGGPCWPRDNVAFSVFMEAIHAPSRLPRAVDLFNEEHARYVLRKLLAITRAGETVGLLGLAYKPGTSCIDRSFAVDLAGWLVREGRSVVGWDPLAMSEVRLVLGETMSYASSPLDCLKRSKVGVLINPLAGLAELDWSQVPETVVVDCWRCLPAAVTAKIDHYVPLGQGPNQEVAGWIRRLVGDYFDLMTN